MNYNGHVLLDSFVKPKERVTNFLTEVSGITPQRIKFAPTLDELRTKIDQILDNKLIIGHSIHNDFQALEFTQAQQKMVRDISTFREYMYNGKKTKLQTLAQDFLKISIQGGDHNSIEDARATLALYRLKKQQIDAELKFKK